MIVWTYEFGRQGKAGLLGIKQCCRRNATQLGDEDIPLLGGRLRPSLLCVASETVSKLIKLDPVGNKEVFGVTAYRPTRLDRLSSSSGRGVDSVFGC